MAIAHQMRNKEDCNEIKNLPAVSSVLPSPAIEVSLATWYRALTKCCVASSLEEAKKGENILIGRG
jgi:hypothetical protein